MERFANLEEHLRKQYPNAKAMKDQAPPDSNNMPDAWREPPLPRVADRAACGRHASRRGCARRRLLRERRLHRQDVTDVPRQMDAAREQAAADVLDHLALPAASAGCQTCFRCQCACGGSVLGRPPPSQRGRNAPGRRAPLCGRFVLVAAKTIAELALRFGLTVDQVTNELEAWALCAPCCPTAPPECIQPQCMQRAWPPPFCLGCP
jgi:hypothetical protein